ncbi:hypothetical protein MKW94_004397 [Papaver nudicaule]|uniref:Uncharacterized protein n=1 Tax=Papaver nudicaule TaxID=74823 RepID=A0AA41VFE6_PAPNU|nr:hypothetical protein [Papaver nudicaule]
MGDQVESNVEIEIHHVCEENDIHSKQLAGNPICVLSRQSKNKSASEERFKSGRKLCGLIVFCVVFILIEIVGGVKANSLAVLGDAAHLFTDVVGFGVSLFTVWASSWEATQSHSFGFSRFEVLGALFSVQLIWLISGILIYEAIGRILNRTGMVYGKLMFFTAVFGFIINLMMLKWLGHDHSGGCDDHHHHHNHRGQDSDPKVKEEKMSLMSSSASEHSCDIEHNHTSSVSEHSCDIEHNHTVELKSIKNWISCAVQELSQKHVNMNLQGAYLHILGDLIQSIGVMIGGAVIWAKPNWLIIDLLCTLGFAVLVLGTTVPMLRNLLAILAESAPSSINVAEVQAGLVGIKGVHSVYDLHVWSMAVGKVLLSCHVIAEQGANLKDILSNIREFCERTYEIHHVTVQIDDSFN